MSTTRTMYLLTALLLAVAAIEPSSAESRLSDSLEPSVESLATAQDYWSASKLSFQLANERSRNNDDSLFHGVWYISYGGESLAAKDFINFRVD